MTKQPLTARQIAARLNAVINDTGGLYAGQSRIRRARSSFGEVEVLTNGGSWIPWRAPMWVDVRDWHSRPVDQSLLSAGLPVQRGGDYRR